MAYGILYRTSWYDLEGISKRLDILEDGYTGSIINVQSNQDPVMLAWDADSDNKYPIFKSSSMDIFLLSPSRLYFRNLFTSNKFKYKVHYYIADTTVWTGYLLSDLYTENYDHKNYTVNFKATDGLGLLQNIPFLDSSGDYYTGRRNDMYIITECLSKLNLNININTAVNIWETRMTQLATDDPLRQAYNKMEAFKDMMCSDVLKAILKPYGCMIYQEANEWNIVRMNLPYKGSYTRKKYNSAGAYQSNEVYDPSNSLTNHTATRSTRNVMVMGSTTLEMIPGMRSLNIFHDYGMRENLLTAGDNPIDSFTLINGWYQSDYWVLKNDTSKNYVIGTIYNLENQLMQLQINGWAADFLAASPFAYTKYIEHYVYLDQDTDNRFNIEMELMPYARKQGSPEYSAEVQLVFQIQCGSYYLTSEGWSNTATDWDQFLRVNDFKTGQSVTKFSYSADGIPASENIKIRIFQTRIDSASVPPGITFTIYVRSVKVFLTSEDPLLPTEINFETIIDENNNYIPEEIEVLVGDGPDVNNALYIYKNIKELYMDGPTKLWQEEGSSFQEPLIVALARMISDQYLYPTISYDALIRDSHISIGDIVDDPFDGLKYTVHEIIASNEGDRDCRCRLLEIYDSENLLTESGEELLTESGENILTD